MTYTASFTLGKLFLKKKKKKHKKKAKNKKKNIKPRFEMEILTNLYCA